MYATHWHSCQGSQHKQSYLLSSGMCMAGVQLESRLQDFQAENALLGRTLKDVQAERRVQATQLHACQEHVTQLKQQLQDSKAHVATVQKEVQELTVAGARRDQQLQLSLDTRKELEAIVLDLQLQLDQLAPLPSVPPPHLKPQPKLHTQPTPEQPHPLPTQLPQQAPPQQHATAVCHVARIPRPVRHPTAAADDEPAHASDLRKGSKQDQEAAGHVTGAAAWRQAPARASLDLRTGMSRLEQLYQSQLQLMQQDCDSRVQTLQQQHAAALTAAQDAAADALRALKQEAAQQVQDAESTLQRQLQQQVRLIEQLEKRCIALEARVASTDTHTGSSNQPARVSQCQCSKAAAPWKAMLDSVVPHVDSSMPGADEGAWGVAELRNELLTVRRQLQEARSAQQHAVAATEVVINKAAMHQKAAADSQARQAKLRQELCAAVQQQHDLTAMTTQQQQQLCTLTSQLAAAEAAIKDLRAAVCDAREQLLQAQATTQTHVLSLALAHAQCSSRPQDVELLLKENTGPVAIYIRVLEHACKEAVEHEAALKRAVNEAQYLEQQARALLATSRDDQMAMQRALLKQVQQVHTMEELRLSDVQELQQLVSQRHA